MKLKAQMPPDDLRRCGEFSIPAPSSTPTEDKRGGIERGSGCRDVAVVIVGAVAVVGLKWGDEEGEDEAETSQDEFW